MPMLMLWSAPRSRSTAFYRMMIERGDFTGVHEPFSYVTVFGNAEISGRPLATVPEVIAELRSLAATRHVFIKDTTDRRHPGVLADRRFLGEDAQHTFLIRHPRETIRSYLAVRRNPRIHEIGLEAQYEVYTKVSRLTGRDPLIVDADDLMNRPADTIKAYCAHVGIDFRPHALSWRPSERPEWQPFRHWFTGVAASSGLAEVPSRRRLDVEQHPMLGTYLEYHLPFYQKLYQRRLMVLGHSGMTAGRSRKPDPDYLQAQPVAGRQPCDRIAGRAGPRPSHVPTWIGCNVDLDAYRRWVGAAPIRRDDPIQGFTIMRAGRRRPAARRWPLQGAGCAGLPCALRRSGHRVWSRLRRACPAGGRGTSMR